MLKGAVISNAYIVQKHLIIMSRSTAQVLDGLG